MNRSAKGSFTVEAALVIPMVLVVVGVLLHILFYYHDKTILNAATHATAAYGCSREVPDERKMESYFEERIKNRCMLFAKVDSDMEIERDQVTVQCVAKYHFMSVKSKSSIEKTNPEDYIREIRKIKKIGEELAK